VAASPPYELVDFGNGRKLERFGPYLVDRPCPAADRAQPHASSLWDAADARFDRTEAAQGRWTHAAGFPTSWTVNPGRLCMELRTSATGQTGLFPEQMGNWAWLQRQLAVGKSPFRVLNLFGYTGGASLAAAAGGARVVHVDASKSAVTWARRNAAHSHLDEAPIRWITDDAMQFVQREIRRGNTYHGFILDPPSYGHGPKGQAWKIDRHLAELLAGCARLLADRPHLLLLTCHTPEWTEDRLCDLAIRCFPACGRRGFAARRLQLRAADGRSLPSGVAVRWSGG
jgi:23S rRNA (cytosine1962-C5)-methyltransferase